MRGTFVMIGSGVTRPALLQNNIFSGIGSLSTQASSVVKTNYRSIAPGFVKRSTYDLRPSPNALIINAGSVPNATLSGYLLAPSATYKHLAWGATRPVTGALDIGAYESTSTDPSSL